MSEVVRAITESVRGRLRHDNADARAAVGRYTREEIRSYSERALAGALPPLRDEDQIARLIEADIAGFGPLQPLLDDPDIEEIWSNGPGPVWIARGGRSELAPIVLDADGLRDLVERMLQSTGRRVDLSSPFVDASLPDGSRLHVAIPDITRAWSLNIRRFHRRIRTLADLVERGALPRTAAVFLSTALVTGHNVIVSGATQAGKTTMVGALLNEVGHERIVSAEETFELDLEASDHVAMQCRQPNLEGAGEVTLRRLVKEALRMRPDRLVVGEVREAEALDLLLALNSGVPGICSIHANSAADALLKLCTLPLLAGRNIDARFVVPTVAASVDLVVHCEMGEDGGRRVVEVAAVTGETEQGRVVSEPLWSTRGRTLRRVGAWPDRRDKWRRAGLDPDRLDEAVGS